MRIAVIADTHMPRGSRVLSPECLDALARADLILHAGDVTAAPVLETLGKLAPVHAVYGNMDDPELQGSLPPELIVDTEGARIGMLHIPGPVAGRAVRLAQRFPGCDAVVYGHTHMPEVTRHGSVWILNPGSPTERRRAESRSMLTLEVDGGSIIPKLLELP